MKKKEFAEKMRRMSGYLTKNNADGVLLSKKRNFSWLSCGADNHVVLGTEVGYASFLSMRAKNYIITTNIEAGRIKNEEMKELGFEVIEYPWYEEQEKYDIYKDLVKEKTILSDDGYAGTKLISQDFNELKMSLTKDEVERYLILGDKSANAVEAAAEEIKKGDTEHKVSAILSKNLLEKGIKPFVLLVAADERIDNYRHPIPTDKKIKDRVMMVVCAQKWGLICSLTRILAFSAPDDELKKKHEAVTRIDTVMNMNTRLGIEVGDIVRKAQGQYETEEFRDEWRLHHQGGPAGYEGRYYIAMPDETREVVNNQAFAWNPSITGTKSEDTIINTEEGILIVTESNKWPVKTVDTQFGSLKRPDIWVK